MKMEVVETFSGESKTGETRSFWLMRMEERVGMMTYFVFELSHTFNRDPSGVSGVKTDDKAAEHVRAWFEEVLARR